MDAHWMVIWLLEDTGYKGSLWLSSFPKHDNWKLIAPTRCSLCFSCLVCSSCLFLPWRPLMLGSTPPSLRVLPASYPWFGRSVCSSSIWGRKKGRRDEFPSQLLFCHSPSMCPQPQHPALISVFQESFPSFTVLWFIRQCLTVRYAPTSIANFSRRLISQEQSPVSVLHSGASPISEQQRCSQHLTL